MKSQLLNYFLLTKPRILLLVLLTGVTALIVEGSLLTTLGSFLLVLLGLFLASGSANAFNQYFEREVDAKMSRTAGRRPLPMGKIAPLNALVFALVLGAGSTVIFAVFFNLLSSMLALATVLFYGFFYTLILKPRTSLNIVIGGAAGAMTPVIAWAAASGSVNLVSLLMAALIFIWTPPHFWSLAIIFRKDYEKVSYPMTPNIIGIPATYKKMIYYSFLADTHRVAFVLGDGGAQYFSICLVNHIWCNSPGSYK